MGLSMAETAEQPPRDALAHKLEHSIRLPAFEGPLDLLLFLIRRNEVDIYEIPIETVTRQYLDVLRKMEQMDLEVAGDFFVMASTLMYIKSRMLLPRNDQIAQEGEDSEEEIDPRWELVQQLIEYKKFKDAARDIQDLIENRQDLLPRHYIRSEEEKESRPLQPSDRIELWNTFNMVIRRLAEKMERGQIHDEQVSVADRMEIILARLQTQKDFLFSSLIEEGANFNTLVATFLAVLELARLKHLFLEQDEAFTDIRCTSPAEALA